MANGKAVLEILGEDRTAAAWRSAVKGASSAADSIKGMWGTAFSGIGVAAIARIASQSIEMGDAIGKASVKSGIAAEQFQTLAYAAKQSDIDLNSLSTALKKMQVALSEANSGGKAQIETLNALGVPLERIRDLQPDKQFEVLAGAIASLKDPADRARAATEIFGKAGADLLPMFEQGSEGIRKAREEFERMGGVLGGDTLKKLSDADDAIKRMNQSWTVLAMTLTASVAPALTRIANEASHLSLKSVAAFMAEFGPGRVPLMGNAVGAAADAEFGGSANSDRRGVIKRKTEESASAPGYKSKATTKDKQVDDMIASLLWQVNEEERILMEGFTKQQQLAAEHADFMKGIDDKLATDASDSAKRFFEAQSAYGADFNKNLFKAADEMSTYAEQAARNMQDAFANFLFDPFKGGVKGMLKGFVDMMRQMLAQAAASSILKSIFGAGSGGSGNGLAGFLGGLFSGFGGARAGGGPVMAGSTYLVGERGPELFTPGSSGSITPNHALAGGGVTVAPVYNIDARGATTDLVKQLPAILEASNRRAVEMARAQIRDDLSRGAFRR